MRSIQFNYFASGSDLKLIAETILSWQPQLVIFPLRGLGEVLHGTPVRDASVLIPSTVGEMHLLCAAVNADRVATDIVDERISCIQTSANPVIEYSPSAALDSETAKIGRLFANFSDVDFMKELKELFTSLRKSARQLADSDLWIFPEATTTKPRLRPWGGKDWENPFIRLSVSKNPSEGDCS